jgi:23S rRNA (uracil-5-)-methyltransferase RumA
MGRRSRKKLKGEQIEVTPQKLNWKGRFVASIPEGKVWVNGGYPGYPCMVECGRSGKGHVKASVVEYVKKPDYAIEPICPLFHRCGGCTLQHAEIHEQHKWKKELLLTTLDGLKNLPDEDSLRLYSSPQSLEYRNKMEFTFAQDERDNSRHLGLHEQGRFQTVLNIDTCYLQMKSMQEIFSLVSKIYSSGEIPGYNVFSHEGILRHLVLRGSSHTGGVLVSLVVREWDERLQSEYIEPLLSLPVVESLYIIENPSISDAVKYDNMRLIQGKGYLEEKIGNKLFHFASDAFFQVNSKGVEVLYEAIASMIKEQGAGGGKLLDLYCGAGTIGIYLSELFEQVLGIEEIESAVAAAKENAKRNGLTNTSYYCGKVEQSSSLVSMMEGADVLILDPPRSGCHPKARNLVGRLGISNLIFVSCNPVVLKTELLFLEELGYEIQDLRVVDMFPQTAHVETIVFMKLKA